MHTIGYYACRHRGLTPHLSKTLYFTFEALQLGTTGDQDLRAKQASSRRASGPWASPIVVVPKKSRPGEPPRQRMCVDFRKINELQPQVRRVDSATSGNISLVPLPKIDEMYAALRGAKIFNHTGSQERLLPHKSR